MILRGVLVATVLTVYGIETTVHHKFVFENRRLQQYLPFTVLKPSDIIKQRIFAVFSCNSTYRLRY